MSVPCPPSVPAATVETLRRAGSVFAEEEAALLAAAARTPVELAALVDRRVSGVPLEQVLGWAEFCGLRIAVAPGVFVPRRRSALLVREAVALVDPQGVVVDLCCGSGAVGAAVAARVGPICLHAVDLDPVAVECARRNLSGVRGRAHEGDLYEALPRALRGRVDVLVANAPYVPSAAIGLMPPEARAHEPRAALDGGADGLEVVRRVCGSAAEWLAPGGHLLVETSAQQAARTAGLMSAQGLDPRVVRCDDLDATIVVGSTSARVRCRRRP